MTVAYVDQSTTTVTSVAATPFNINIPTVSSGDLLVVTGECGVTDPGVATSSDFSFTKWMPNGTALAESTVDPVTENEWVFSAYRVCDGTEGSTLSVTLANAAALGFVVWHWTGDFTGASHPIRGHSWRFFRSTQDSANGIGADTIDHSGTIAVVTVGSGGSNFIYNSGTTITKRGQVSAGGDEYTLFTTDNTSDPHWDTAYNGQTFHYGVHFSFLLREKDSFVGGGTANIHAIGRNHADIDLIQDDVNVGTYAPRLSARWFQVINGDVGAITTLSSPAAITSIDIPLELPPDDIDITGNITAATFTYDSSWNSVQTDDSAGMSVSVVRVSTGEVLLGSTSLLAQGLDWINGVGAWTDTSEAGLYNGGSGTAPTTGKTGTFDYVNSGFTTLDLEDLDVALRFESTGSRDMAADGTIVRLDDFKMEFTYDFITNAQTWAGTAVSVSLAATSGTLEETSPIPVLSTVDVGEDYVDMSWTQPGAEVGYDIRRGGAIIQRNYPLTTYRDTPLLNDTEYTHEVRAVLQTWLPSSLPGLALWFDASDESTIGDTAGAVDSWTSKGAGGEVLLDRTAQPTTGATTQNGLNVVDFVAVNDEHMHLGGQTAFAEEGTYFAVVRANDTTANKTVLGLGTSQPAMLMGANEKGGGYVDNDWAPAPLSTTSTTDWCVLTVRHHPVTNGWWVSINGETPTLADAGVAAATGNAAEMQIGAHGANTTHTFDGSIAEIIVVRDTSVTPLTAAEITQIEKYLTDKWMPFESPPDLDWHSLFWAEGEAFKAEGYADDAVLTSWPNETAEVDLTTIANTPQYKASDPYLNNRPAVYSLAGTSDTARNDTGFDASPSIAAPLSIVWIGEMGAKDQNSRFFASMGSLRLEARGDGSGGIALNYNGVRISYSAGDNPNGLGNLNRPYLMVGILDGASSDLDLDGAGVVTGDLSSGGAWSNDTVGVPSQTGLVGVAEHSTALVGLFEGDIRLSPDWPDFKSWVTSHYGILLA